MHALRWLVEQILEESDEEAGNEDEAHAPSCTPPAASSTPRLPRLAKPPLRTLRAASSCPEEPAATASSSPSVGASRRFRRLRSALADPLIERRRLADLVWLGVPDGPERCEAWQTLLGYRPLSQERRFAALRRKRQNYRDLRHEILDSKAMVLSPSRASWDPLVQGDEATALAQIRRDLPRITLCGASSVGDGGQGGAVAGLEELLHDPRIQALMERVLLIWSVRQPAAGYVQGHLDVLLPLLLVFLAGRVGVGLAEGRLRATSLDTLPHWALEEVEADCFWCFSKVLSEVVDYYTEGQPGLQRAAVLLRAVLAEAHRDLLEDFEAEGVDMAAVVLRWLGCLMVRELPLPLCVRVWDTCVAESVLAEGRGFAGFLVYFSASLLASHADELHGASFDKLMAFVQQPPTERLELSNIEMLISAAHVLGRGGNCGSRRPQAGPCLDARSSTLTTSASSASSAPWSPRGSESDSGSEGEDAVRESGESENDESDGESCEASSETEEALFPADAGFLLV